MHISVADSSFSNNLYQMQVFRHKPEPSYPHPKDDGLMVDSVHRSQHVPMPLISREQRYKIKGSEKQRRLWGTGNIGK